MFQKQTNYFLIIVIAIWMSLAFNSPTEAKDCGGNIPCACGDNVVANRTVEKDPVLKGFCPGTALFMNTAGVTLIIKGPGPLGSPDPHEQRGPGDGIRINADNVTLRGGKLEGFQHGVIGTTNGSTILKVNADHNAVNGINLTGNGNTIEESKGTHTLGNGAGEEGAGEDGILITGNNNVLRDNYGQKTAAGFVGIRVIGSDNLIEDNFVEKGEGGGILVTGGFNIDGGSNNVKKILGTPKCEIDGNPCLP
jgi:hypothetical protein